MNTGVHPTDDGGWEATCVCGWWAYGLPGPVTRLQQGGVRPPNTGCGKSEDTRAFAQEFLDAHLRRIHKDTR